MNIDTRLLWAILLSLAYLPITWAEPAKYKEVKLTPVENLLIIGNVEVTFIQSDALKAEVILRDSSTSTLQLGTENNDDGTRLVIQEQLPVESSQWEKLSMARVTLYLPSIINIHLQNIAKFKINNVTQKKLHLYVKGKSQLEVDNITADDFRLELLSSANVKIEKLQVKSAQIIQPRSSVVSITNSSIDNLFIENRQNSQFTANNVRGEKLHVLVKTTAKTKFSGDSHFASAKFVARNHAEIDSALINFTGIDLIAKDDSKVKLGKAKALKIQARDSAQVSYFPTENINLIIRQNAKVEQYQPSTYQQNINTEPTAHQHIEIEQTNE